MSADTSTEPSPNGQASQHTWEPDILYARHMTLSAPKLHAALMAAIPDDSTVTEYDVTACLHAIKMVLGETSSKKEYQCGLYGLKQVNIQGHPWGAIETDIAQLCRIGYGIAEGTKVESAYRRKMKNTLNALFAAKIFVALRTGIKIENRPLLLRDPGAADMKKRFVLGLHPIFADDSHLNYGKLPHEASYWLSYTLNTLGKRGKGCKSAAHIRFLEWIGIQKPKQIRHIRPSTLISYIGLAKTGDNRDKLMAKLRDLFNIFLRLGYLEEYPKLSGLGTFEIITSTPYRPKTLKDKLNRGRWEPDENGDWSIDQLRDAIETIQRDGAVPPLSDIIELWVDAPQNK